MIAGVSGLQRIYQLAGFLRVRAIDGWVGDWCRARGGGGGARGLVSVRLALWSVFAAAELAWRLLLWRSQGGWLFCDACSGPIPDLTLALVDGENRSVGCSCWLTSSVCFFWYWFVR